MNEKMGISQQTIVSNIENENVPAKKLPQYVASLSSTLGALAVGMVLSWTSSAGIGGKSLRDVYEIQISETEFSWISSLSTLGGGVACIPMGILTNIIGRKFSMLLTTIPFTVGWLLIIFANSVLMLYIGRFIAGFSAGAFCVVARELSIISATVPFIYFGIFVFMPESPIYYLQKGDEAWPHVFSTAQWYECYYLLCDRYF